MNQINFNLDVDKEKIVFVVPKRKSMSKVYSYRSMLSVTKRLIQKYIWKEEIIPKGEPVDVDDLLREIDNYRLEVYREVYDRYIGRKVIIKDVENPPELHVKPRDINGYITDISFEEGLVDGGIGNVLIDTEIGTFVCSFPSEDKYKLELESEINLSRQKWNRENFREQFVKLDKGKYESIKLKLNELNLKSEDDIEKYLITRLHLIESGLRYISHQYPVNGGIVDILAKDSSDRLCIIEIKAKNDSKDLIWQCMYYPLQFKDEENIRMITVAPGYINPIKTVLDRIPYVEAKKFEIVEDKLNIIDA